LELTSANSDAVIWAQNWKAEPIHIDCTTTVMLKILDGKCKMNSEEKQVIAVIYDVVKDQPGTLLDNSVHDLIAVARRQPDEKILEDVYEQRLYAEQMISRPVMKAYKAMLRREGILANHT
jgi:hypothetical protein